MHEFLERVREFVGEADDTIFLDRAEEGDMNEAIVAGPTWGKVVMISVKERRGLWGKLFNRYPVTVDLCYAVDMDSGVLMTLSSLKYKGKDVDGDARKVAAQVFHYTKSKGFSWVRNSDLGGAKEGRW